MDKTLTFKHALVGVGDGKYKTIYYHWNIIKRKLRQYPTLPSQFNIPKNIEILGRHMLGQIPQKNPR